MIVFDKEILWLVIPVVILISILLLILFVEEWSKVDINGEKY